MESLDIYLQRLASAEPVPGGGSAATVVAAIGAALVGMVARICARSSKYADRAQLLGEIVAKADALTTQLDAARRRDEHAFAQVVAAQNLPKGTPGDEAARRSALEAALRAAAQAPLDASHLALDAARLADRLLQIPNKSLASDIGCACEFAVAALRACAYNVRVNHRYMHDEATIALQEAELTGYETEASAILTRVRKSVSS